MPEIENIALREAFKALGVEAAAHGDDILVRVGRGPGGLFVREAVGVTPAVDTVDAPRKFQRMTLARSGAEDVKSDKASARPSDIATDEVLELLCRNAPGQAFELALDTFARVAETARAMVEEQAIDLALIEAQRMEIDRKQAENRKLLRELVGQEL
jgi:hypothetical protein